MTTEQVEGLLRELPAVIARSVPGPERRGLERLVAMVRVCCSDNALTLRFVGD